jgi:hypothetical protein
LVLKNNNKKKWLTIINLVLVFIITSSIMIIGCKTDTGEQTDVISEPAEEEITEEETEGGRSGEDDKADYKVLEKEITGNINILSGLEISDTVNDSRPIAIMVDNDPRARMQSGLIYADIVFEVVDEGGVTRYIAFYSSYDVGIIFPVRSARIYYAEIARGFDPVYVFWGTYEDAYEPIKKMYIDLFDANSENYVPYTDSGWRDYSRSEVNWISAAISTEGIKEDAASYGYSLEGGQSPMRFKIDATESDRGNISDININFSNNNFIVDFKYDIANNNYLKYIAGQPHTDYETGTQIAVNNVIVMITNIEGPIDESGHMVVRTTGSS